MYVPFSSLTTLEDNPKKLKMRKGYQNFEFSRPECETVKAIIDLQRWDRSKLSQRAKIINSGKPFHI